MAENPYAPPGAPSYEKSPTGEDKLEISILCSTCDAVIRLGDETCPGCARAVTEEEEEALQHRWEMADPAAAMAADKSWWGKAALGFAAAVAALNAIFSLALPMGGLLWWGVTTAALLGLLVWSFRAPRLACLVGIFVYLVSFMGPLVLPMVMVGSYLVSVGTLMALGGAFAAETHLRRRRADMIAAARAGRRSVG